MAVNDIRLGDVGTRVVIGLVEDGKPVNIDDATLMEIVTKNPKDKVVRHAAQFAEYLNDAETAWLPGDGSNGLIEFITVENDIDATGRWLVQGYVETPAGKWHTDTGIFTVMDNL